MDLQIAFSTVLLIIFLIFPGIVLRRAFYSGTFTKQFYQGSFYDRLITTIFWGLVSQTLTLLIYINSIDNSIPFENLISNYINEETKNHIIINNQNLLDFLKYVLISLIVPFLLGLTGHQLIRFFRIDINFNFLRFDNYWHYYLRGEIVSTREFKGDLKTDFKRNGIKETYVDILTKKINDTCLYSGKVIQYSISKENNQLENIFLCNVKRWSNSKKEFVDVPGDLMQIPFNQVLNINLRYFEKKTTIRNRFLSNFTFIFLLISFISILILPWVLFKDISLWNKIIGILCGLSGSVCFSTLLIIIFNLNNDIEKPKKGGTVGAFVIVIIFTLLSLLVSAIKFGII